MAALGKFFCSSATEGFQSFDSGISKEGAGFFHAKLFCLEVGIVEAVEQEVHQIRDNSFSTLCFQKVYQMVVGSRQEFYQNFAYHTNFGLALIGDGQIVEIVDDVSAQLLELSDGRIGVSKGRSCRCLPISDAWHWRNLLLFRRDASGTDSA